MNPERRAKTSYRARCECCATGYLEKRFRKETLEHETEGGTIVHIPADHIPVDVCDVCGSAFVTAETARARHEYVCRALGIITPAEIRRIRDRHALSQSEFSRITSLGLATISRWERGRLLPNPNNNKFLKLLLRNPDVLDKLLELEAHSGVQELTATEVALGATDGFVHIPRSDFERAMDEAARFRSVCLS